MKIYIGNSIFGHIATNVLNLFTCIKGEYSKRNPKVFVCSECGYMVVPEASTIEEYGWKKYKNPKRLVCHHCYAHCDDYKYWKEAYTPEQWEEHVKEKNAEMRKTFK